MTHAWDAENRLVAITNGNNVSTFTYDGQGRRVQIVGWTNGMVASLNQFIWDGLEICQQWDANNSLIKQYFSQGEVMGGNGYFSPRS